jgi:nucleoside-diphosphate-sugar epimerase
MAMEFDYDVDSAVVTGATGGAGSWVADRLADQGVHVTGVDLERPAGGRDNLAFRTADLTAHGETWEIIHEADPDAVIHFAAIPSPTQDPGTRVFENNTTSTYNVLVAAGRNDAEVVWTSSESAYGTVFAEETWLPDYLPVDEAHPLRPEDPYGASKVAGEEVAEMVARRYDVPVTSIRPSTINYPGRYYTSDQRAGYEEGGALSGNFWSYVDVRDVVSMVEAALAAEYDGHEAFLCVADENYLGEPTAGAIEAAAGRLPADCDLEGEQAGLSNAKARAVLGWEPVHDWREAEGEEVPGPDWL